MELTRAAFGTMLKFCDHIETFLKLTEDVEFTRKDLTSGEDAPSGDQLANDIVA